MVEFSGLRDHNPSPLLKLSVEPATSAGFFDPTPLRDPRFVAGFFMPEPTNAGIIAAVSAATIAGCGWIARFFVGRQVERLDDHDRRISQIERTQVTKRDLDRLEKVIHAGNGDIKQSLSDSRRRIDDLYRELRKERH